MNFGRIGKIVLLAAGAIAGAAAMTACQKEDFDDRIFDGHGGKAYSISGNNETAPQTAAELFRGATMGDQNPYLSESYFTADTTFSKNDEWNDINAHLTEDEKSKRAYGASPEQAGEKLLRQRNNHWLIKNNVDDAELERLGLRGKLNPVLHSNAKNHSVYVYSNPETGKNIIMVKAGSGPEYWENVAPELMPPYYNELKNMGFKDLSVSGSTNMAGWVTQNFHVNVEVKIDLQSVIDAINALGDKIPDYTEVLNDIKNYLNSIADPDEGLLIQIKNLIESLKNSVDTGNEQNKAYFEAILMKIGHFAGLGAEDDNTNIIDILLNLSNETGTSRVIIGQILEAIQNLPDHDYAQVLGDILDAIKDQTGSINDLGRTLGETLGKMESNQQTIIELISAMNPNQQVSFGDILAAINRIQLPQGTDYTQLLNDILAQLRTNDNHLTSYGEAILTKLGQVKTSIDGVSVVTGDIRTISGQIKTILENMEFPPGSGSTTVNVDLSVLEATTQAILDKLDDLIPPDYRNLLEQILAKIPTKIGCDCNCDCDAIIDLLTRILGALQSGYNEGTGGFQQEINEI